jgi:SAM-dependent methyltransferase
VDDLSQCVFYHFMDLPGIGEVDGQWDIRGSEGEYLGGVHLTGKRVLEIGTASGHLCFWMERQGAEVVAYDLSEDFDWDVVPFARRGHTLSLAHRKAGYRRMNNAWWLAHRLFSSQARVVYGSVYQIPDSIGPVDIATFSSVLLHLRDPFSALEQALRLTRETVVVTDRLMPLKGPTMEFVPDHREQEWNGTWWWLAPAAIERFVALLGFESTEVKYHKQRHLSGEIDLYSVVGHRTVPLDLP